MSKKVSPAKQGYFDFEREVYSRSPDADIYCILGERSNGKSYAIKNYCFKKAYEHRGEKGFEVNVLRRWDEDITPKFCEDFFCDVEVKHITNGEYDKVTIYRNYIYFDKYDENMCIIKEKRIRLGRLTALNVAERYKSNFDRQAYGYVIYEEFITDKIYLPNEPIVFQEYLQTVFGKRDDGVAYLIGNKISTICPYYDAFGLHNIKSMKQGELHDVNLQGSDSITKLCIYMSNDVGKKSKFMFGSHAKKANGEWDVKQYPLLTYSDLREMTEIYRFVYNYNQHMFMCILLNVDNNTFAFYVEPKTTPIKAGTRVVGDFNADCICTPDFTPLSQGEERAFRLLKEGYMYFNSNLTGDEFRQVRQSQLQSYKFR